MLIFFYLLLHNFWLKVGRKLIHKKLVSWSSNFPRSNAETIKDIGYYGQYIKFSGKKVLDVGCGEGRKTAYYSMLSGEAIGVDVDKYAIRLAHEYRKKRKLNQLHLIVADACHLPLVQNVFDIVVSNDALEHVSNCQRAVHEISQVTRKNGYICINFGPLWRSAFGSHMDFGEFFSPPWVHLIFPEKCLKNAFIRFGKMSESERKNPLFPHLNRISIKQFQKIINVEKLNVLFFKLLCSQPFRPLLRTPLREFLATQIVTLLKKELDCQTLYQAS